MPGCIDDFNECNCECHDPDGFEVHHIMACCTWCPWCSRRMTFHDEDACRLTQRESMREMAVVLVEQGDIDAGEVDAWLDLWEATHLSQASPG
jgi:hypothetical protein